MESVENYDSYFVQTPDVIDQLGLSGLQKYTATMHILAHSIASDATNEYVQLASKHINVGIKMICLSYQG